MSYRELKDDQNIKSLLYKMVLIRKFEEKIGEIYHTDAIKSPVHLSIGQEAVAVGVCSALETDDFVSNTYRCHATHIAKGGNLSKMMAELYGKEDGCAGGKAGSMHLVEIESGILGASAVVGTTIPVATGFAMALKKEAKKTGKQRIIVAFFGDGSTEEGCFSEAINFAALHKLPIIFLCENNKLAIHNPIHRRWPTDRICDRVGAYGIETHQILSGDIFEIQSITKNAVQKLKSKPNSGPIFIECFTYRYREHVGPGEDLNEEYRDLNEYKNWKNNDQIDVLSKLLTRDEVDEINKTVNLKIEESIKFSEKSHFPDAAKLYENVYAKREIPLSLEYKKEENRLLTYAGAIAEASIQEMERDERVFVFGLDTDDHKAIQGSTAGILAKFGSERIFGTPLSEDAMTGIAIGTAIYGYRPVHVHIRMDFVTLCMNQIINMAAKSHYMYNGSVKVPMVVRAMIGRSWGQGAQHSQSLYSLFAHIPGLRVVAPSNAFDAKGCLIAAIRDENPVIFVEHRLLYNVTAFVPEKIYENQLGKGRLVKEGSDITIIGISHMMVEVLRGYEFLKNIGISAEIIDPIWIKPLDIDLIIKSVKKTGKLIIVDNAWLNCGISAEIMAQIHEKMPGERVIMKRIGFAETTCPTTRCLEDHFYPNAKDVVSTALKMLDKKYDSEIKFTSSEIDNFKGPF